MHSDFDRYSDTYRDDVQRSIGFLGQDHDFFVRHKVGQLLGVTRRRVGEPKDLTILDVGCGIGLTDRYLAEEFGSVHGVDVSEESLAIAKDANPTARYQAYDGETLPFSDGSIDVTFAIGVLHHVPVSARSRDWPWIAVISTRASSSRRNGSRRRCSEPTACGSSRRRTSCSSPCAGGCSVPGSAVSVGSRWARSTWWPGGSPEPGPTIGRRTRCEDGWAPASRTGRPRGRARDRPRGVLYEGLRRP